MSIRQSEIPALSVVVACDGAAGRLPDRLNALAAACRGLAAEVVVARAVDTPIRLPDHPPIPTRTVTAPSRLVPVLWGQGIAASRGVVVALTTTQFQAREGWARALLSRIELDEPAGVGGCIALAPRTGLLGRAVYLLRYSEHMPSATAAPPDLAGENAAYSRSAVLRASGDVSLGFWEVDVHRRLRASGARLAYEPQAILDFDPVLSLGAMLRNRYVHGSHFGAYRVRELGWPRWRAVAVTPLVPAVLLLRIIRRARRAGQPITGILVLVPVLLPLLLAWAAGEARGAAFARASGRDDG